VTAKEDDEALPFDVEIERLPTWAHAASGGVIAVGVLVAAGLIPMLAFLPVLVASSVGRRFASSAIHVEVDRDGLALGEREVARSEILDVWLDDDETEPRVIVAIGAAHDGTAPDVELTVLHFQNREQARRFASAFGKSVAVVAGHKPRWVDALSSLRFVAIAAAFFGTRSWYGVLALALFFASGYAFVRAKQIVARADAFDVRTAFGTRTHAYADVEAVDVEAGVIGLPKGAELRLSRGAVRDTTLASPAWLDRARRRALLQIGKLGRLK
jgi:hypothetical protein